MIAIAQKLGLLAALSLFLLACSRPYRVGDHVLVEWGEDKLQYPAFIIERKGKSRFRVHYEGYPSRWDENVDLPRIRGKASKDSPSPPPPLKVRVAQGLRSKNKGSAPISQFKEGDRVRVRWRGTIYRSTVLKVISSGKLRVHYDGHDSAWDEEVPLSRIVDK